MEREFGRRERKKEREDEGVKRRKAKEERIGKEKEREVR